MPQQKAVKPVMNENGYVSLPSKGEVELRDVEFDRETSPDREKLVITEPASHNGDNSPILSTMDKFKNLLKKFNGKRIMYYNPNYQPPEGHSYFMDINATDDEFRLTIPTGNEQIIKQLLNLLVSPMQSGTDPLLCDLDGAKYDHDFATNIRTYSFPINEKFMSQIKQNLIFVISSSGIKQKYGLQGTGVYSRNDFGQFEVIPQATLVDWLLEI